jgi:hypothetical protein
MTLVRAFSFWLHVAVLSVGAATVLAHLKQFRRLIANQPLYHSPGANCATSCCTLSRQLMTIRILAIGVTALLILLLLPKMIHLRTELRGPPLADLPHSEAPREST